MEVSGEEQQQKQQRKSNKYSNFKGMKGYHYLQQAIKTLLRFLGFGSSPNTKSTTVQSPADPDSEVSMTEEFTVLSSSRGIALRSRGAVKKPPTPPVNSGNVGQIHSI